MSRTRTALRPAQRRVIEELKASAGVIAVLGMGGGKTVSALTALRDLLTAGTIRAAIVLAPRKVANDAWTGEVAGWTHLHGLDLVVVSGTPKQRAAKLRERHEVYVVGMENAQWLVDTLFTYGEHPGFDQLVIDEISKLRDARSKRAKRLLDIVARFKSVWGLTGTPRPDSEEDLWMPLQIVSASTAWADAFDEWRRARFRPLDYQGHQWKCHTFAVEEIRRVFDTWAFTIPASEVVDTPFNSGDDLDIYVDLCDAAIRDLRTLDKELLVELGLEGAELRVDDLDEDTLFVLSKAVATGKMDQVLQGFLYHADGETVQTYAPVKLNALADTLEEIGGEPTIIPYHYREDLIGLKGLIPGLKVLGAGVNDKQAARTIEAWNAGDIQRLALHPASAGHGLNLQFGGRRMVWYRMTWSKDLYAQTVKRLARPGQREPVFVHRIRARHWMEDLRINRVEHGLIEQQDWIDNMRTL